MDLGEAVTFKCEGCEGVEFKAVITPTEREADCCWLKERIEDAKSKRTKETGEGAEKD
jgi:hypothetical protein